MINIIEKELLTPNKYEKYKIELLNIFNENFFKNGGMLYSDDFLTNSNFIIIAKKDRSVVAYMAVSLNVENELDREHDKYTEEPVLNNSLVIKHLVVKKHYRNLKIATELIQEIKQYAIKNKINNLYLWTTPDNVVALKFYKRMGFHKMGDYLPPDGYFQGLENFHSIMMNCKIYDKNY